MKKLFIISICCINLTFAQVLPLVKDFLINGKDNTPSTFTQYSPRLSFTNSDNFIVSWIDYREGEGLVYTQKFNRDGMKVGENFKISGNNNVYSNKNGYVLTLNNRWEENIIYTMTYTDGTLYSPSGQFINNENLCGGISPWCGTGFIYGEEQVAASDSCFYFLTNYGGGIVLRKVTQSGEFKTIENTTSESFITKTASAATSNGNYFFAWIKGSKNPEDSLETGLYATFVNDNDLIIMRNLPIQLMKSENYDWYIENYMMRAVSLNETTYKLFWMQHGSNVLNSVKLSTMGKIVSPVDSTLLPSPASGSYISDFQITNVAEDGFYIIISTGYEYNKYLNCYAKYDIDGNNISNINSEISTESTFNKKLFYRGNDKFFSAISDDKDVFLNSGTINIVTESQIINDDISGSNERNLGLVIYDDNTVFATWHDEENNYGTQIDKNGNILHEKTKLNVSINSFFRNKEAISLWVLDLNDSTVAGGYTIYNADLEKKFSKTIYTADRYSSSNNLHILTLSDSVFLLLVNTGNALKLVKEDRSGNTIKEKVLYEGNSIYGEKIFLRDANSVWVNWSTSLQKFSTDLEALSERIDFPNITTYIGDDRFINYYYEYINGYPQYYNTGKIYGTIINSSLDTLKSKIMLKDFKYDGSEISIESFPDHKFLVIGKYDNKYMGRLFSNDGIALKDLFLISSSTATLADIRFLVLNDKVFFTWSDSKNIGKGYDIYGNVFNLSAITDIREIPSALPGNYSISQNYPNPFNPVTKIRFSIPEYSNVLIKVYDVLGSEVAVVVNEEMQAGTYETVFNGNNLSSGIYYYTITASGYTESRKMVLLK